jgi:hypothetical protein
MCGSIAVSNALAGGNGSPGLKNPIGFYFSLPMSGNTCRSCAACAIGASVNATTAVTAGKPYRALNLSPSPEVSRP